MENQELNLLKKIQDIIFSIPHELYKYSRPNTCFEVEWKDSSEKEKAYLLVKDALLNYNKAIQQTINIDDINNITLNLGRCPTFYSNADENMFFKAIYSMPSFVKINGAGVELTLYCKKSVSKNEIEFIINLLKRYGVKANNDLIMQLNSFET